MIDSVASVRLLVTGGTGMTGQWCLHYLNDLATKAGTEVHVLLLTRRPQTETVEHIKALSHLTVLPISIDNLRDTIRVFRPSHVWHFSADTRSGSERQLESLRRADLDIARLVLEAVSSQSSSTQFLYTSSGAVYGRNRETSTPVTESHPVNSIWTPNLDPYDIVKLETEQLLMNGGGVPGVTTGICRLFAFVGPLVPTNAHFAIGNFLGNAARGEPIVMKSMGNDVRSWLYCADLARYLVNLTFLTRNYIVNVGSRESFSIREAAYLVSRIAGVPVRQESPPVDQAALSYYLPDITYLDELVHLDSLLSLEESLRVTLRWLRDRN